MGKLVCQLSALIQTNGNTLVCDHVRAHIVCALDEANSSAMNCE